MKKAKILLGFTKLSDANLDLKANAVLTAMTGNVHFPEPQPSLEALDMAIQNFSAAVSASQTRHKVSVVAKKNMRRALEQVLQDLAAFVGFHANGDRLMLVSSGFDVNAAFNSPRVLGEPKNFALLPGKHSGEAMVSVDRVPGGVIYIYLYAPAPAANNLWMHAVSGSSSLLLTGLDPLKLYSFRVAIAGSRGQVVYTDIITRMVI